MLKLSDLIHNANIGVVDAFLNSIPKKTIEVIKSLFSWDIMESEAYFGNPLGYQGIDSAYKLASNWKCLTRIENDGYIDSEFGQIFHKKSYETISNTMLEDIVSGYLAMMRIKG